MMVDPDLVVVTACETFYT